MTTAVKKNFLFMKYLIFVNISSWNMHFLKKFKDDALLELSKLYSKREKIWMKDNKKKHRLQLFEVSITLSSKFNQFYFIWWSRKWIKSARRTFIPSRPNLFHLPWRFPFSIKKTSRWNIELFKQSLKVNGPSSVGIHRKSPFVSSEVFSIRKTHRNIELVIQTMRSSGISFVEKSPRVPEWKIMRQNKRETQIRERIPENKFTGYCRQRCFSAWGLRQIDWKYLEAYNFH